MIAAHVEPLEPGIWFDQVRTLATRLSQLGGGTPEAVIRTAFYLVQLTPAPMRDVIRCEVEEEAFERMLDCGAYDAAVTALLGPPVGFEISREPEQDGVSAIVRLPGDTGLGKARDDTVARALLAAWSNCLEDARTRAADEVSRDRGPRKGRSAQPRRSSRH